MKNAIYQGTVIHHRFTPKEHKFIYRVNYFFFNLEDYNNIPSIPFVFGFNPEKYLSSNVIRESINSKFGDEAERSVTKIQILTQLSYFGFCFNPVSFYYCYNASDKLLFILSQITNTPWGEKHIDCFRYSESNGEFHFPKEFHVSPFMPMEINYIWKFNEPGDSLVINMNNYNMNEIKKFFYAHMNLKSKELNKLNTFLSFISFPLMSFKTVFGIYWQAFLLFLKKVPFHTHPKKREAI